MKQRTKLKLALYSLLMTLVPPIVITFVLGRLFVSSSFFCDEFVGLGCYPVLTQMFYVFLAVAFGVSVAMLQKRGAENTIWAQGGALTVVLIMTALSDLSFQNLPLIIRLVISALAYVLIFTLIVRVKPKKKR